MWLKGKEIKYLIESRLKIHLSKVTHSTDEIWKVVIPSARRALRGAERKHCMLVNQDKAVENGRRR